MTGDELREHLAKALRTAGFVDFDDGTVASYPHGNVGAVWVPHQELVDTVINNWPYPIHDDSLDRLDCTDPDIGFDELVASNVSVHMEMDSDRDAYLNIYADAGTEKFAQVFIHARKNKLLVNVEDFGVWAPGGRA